MRNVHFRFPSVAQKRWVCFLKEIQRIFLSDPANAFQMATSKKLLLERAQRLVIGLPEKLVEPHFGYVRDGVFAKGHFLVISSNLI